MTAKLYVGNIPFSTTDQELQNVFAQHGNVVSAKVITDRYSGRSRGFGFVEMSSVDEAQNAITHLNGTEFGGRILVVNEARPQDKRPPFRGGQRGPREYASPSQSQDTSASMADVTDRAQATDSSQLSPGIS
ncbi:MAG: RNA-binding protein [Nitrospirae bacterium]|nr:MAG: RNA-binding protein [Nitrospirota bacterium]